MADEAKGQSGGKKTVLIVAGIIIVILVGIITVMAAKLISSNKSGNNSNDRSQDIQGKAVVSSEGAEEFVDELYKESDTNVPSYYTVTQNSNWIFQDGTSPSENARVVNLEENDTPVYFDLIVNDTGDVVYSSPIIELGGSLSGFSLDKPLDAGEYDCVVEYHLIDDDRNTLTTVSVGVTVTVNE